MRDAPIRTPESEAIIERVRGLIVELYVPADAPIESLVNAEIGRVIANGHQISDLVGNTLNVAEFKSFGTGNNTGRPSFPTIGGNGISPSSACSPHYIRVHWADGDQKLGRAAGLRNQFRLGRLGEISSEIGRAHV